MVFGTNITNAVFTFTDLYSISVTVDYIPNGYGDAKGDLLPLSDKFSS